MPSSRPRNGLKSFIANPATIRQLRGFFFRAEDATVRIMADTKPTHAAGPLAPNDPELHRRIEEALDMIRPYLMTDGGSVRLLNVTEDYVVELELLGACGTCPMSLMTLRAGIEQVLKRAVPEITRVEAVQATS